MQTLSEKDNLSKIRWHCRRGMLELDKILIPFFDAHYEILKPETQVLFQTLLTMEDQTLFSWLLGQEIPDDPKLHDLVLVIRHYATALELTV